MGSFGDVQINPWVAFLTRIIFHFFAKGHNASKTTDEVVQNGWPISYKTMKGIYCQIRRMITDFLNQEYSHSGLGMPHAIEMDESLFSHLRFTNEEGDLIMEQKWVIGMYETDIGNIRAFAVPNRTMDTINSLVLAHLKPNTEIWTDMWLGHNQLNQLGFDHNTINHSRGF